MNNTGTHYLNGNSPRQMYPTSALSGRRGLFSRQVVVVVVVGGENGRTHTQTHKHTAAHVTAT